MRYQSTAGLDHDQIQELVARIHQAAVAGLSGASESFREAVGAQHRLTTDHLRHADARDVVTLGAFAALTANRFEVDRGTPQVLDALEIGVQRNASVLGADHPQTLVALLNLACARFQDARDRDTPEAVLKAFAELEDVTGRTVRVLGRDHPQAVAAESNRASAQFEVARVHRSVDRALEALIHLRRAASRAARLLGVEHPQALIVLSNLASAEFNLVRAEGSRDRALAALDTLTTASARSAAVLGARHPATRILDEELKLCAAYVHDEEDSRGGTALLTRVRTQTRSGFGFGFGEDYVPFHEITQPAAPVATAVFPSPSVHELVAEVERLSEASYLPIPYQDNTPTTRAVLLRVLASSRNPRGVLAVLRSVLRGSPTLAWSRCGWFQISVRSSSSRLQLRIQRSMTAFIRGIRTPVRTTWMPASASMASNSAGNLLSRSRIRNCACRRSSSRSMMRFGAWVTQDVVGCAVAPTTRIRRLKCSITASTYRRAPLNVCVSKKSQASSDSAWERRKGRPGRRDALGSWPTPACLRICQTVEAATLMPRTTSSPWSGGSPRWGSPVPGAQHQEPDRADGPWSAGTLGAGSGCVAAGEEVSVPPQNRLRAYQ